MIPAPQPGPRPSTLDSRRNWPILVFALLFASCILFAHAWFNTDLGRPSSVIWNSPPSSGIRPRWPVFLLALPFLASILASWAWFNTDIGRLNGRGQMTDDRYQNRPPSSVIRHLSSGYRTGLRPPNEVL